MNRRSSGLYWVAALGIALVAGCGSQQSPEEESKVDVVPQVQGRMWRLSGQLIELDRTMSRPDSPERRAEILRLLGTVERIASELNTPEIRQSHELMATEVGGFQEKIVSAKQAAALEPPNYYFAGKLYAACVACHDPEGGIWLR